MRLISYHIKNYGILHDEGGAFENGLTSFCEENGSGKTTLASFLKAMFYGLESYTATTKSLKETDKELPERMRYYPFNRGNFGGNITFEKGGKTYRIERFFGEKSNKNDTLTVYCNGQKTDELGEEIGKAVFGLDEQAFCKTVFIDSKEVDIKSTHSINEKLNRIVDSTDEENNFETAKKVLEDKAKEYKSARSGYYYEEEKKIRDLNGKIRDIENTQKALQGKYGERKALAEAIAVLQKEDEECNERSIRLEQWKNHDENMSSCQQELLSKRTEVAQKEGEYPNGIPDEEERKKLTECLQQENTLAGEMKATALSREKSDRLRTLKDKYEGKLISDGIMEEKQDKLSRIQALKVELSALQKNGKTPKDEDLEQKFKHKYPSAEALSAVEANVNTYKSVKAKYEAVSDAMNESVRQENPKKKVGLGVALLALSILLFGGGIGLLFVEKIIAFVLFGAGVILLILGVALSFSKGKNNNGQKEEITSRRAELQGECKDLEDKIREYLIPYGYFNSNIEVAWRDFSSDLKAYDESVCRLRNAGASAEALTKEKAELERDVSEFLRAFGADDKDLRKGLDEIQKERIEFASLKDDERRAENNITKQENDLEALRSARFEILKKYDLSGESCSADGIEKMASAERDIRRLKLEIKEKEKEELLLKEKEKELPARPEAEERDVRALKELLKEKTEELARKGREIEDMERDVERLADLENELKIAEEKKAYYKERSDILNKAVDSLKQAEQRLKDKYVQPIQEKFSSYAQMLGRVFDKKISMDKDYRVSVEQDGAFHEDRHLSAGERTICALCLRLALIDNMYKDEQPFIVMDDPFVHLDKKHVEKAAEVVKVLSENRQIIYFCCHESRNI